jgi:hypothetical protein
MKHAGSFRFASIFMAIAVLLQIFGLIKYLDRLPEDWAGIGLYIVTIVAFVIASFGFDVKWRSDTSE